MEISDNVFENNRGEVSCISIITNANTDENRSITKIKDNLFRENDGTTIYGVPAVYVLGLLHLLGMYLRLPGFHGRTISH